MFKNHHLFDKVRSLKLSENDYAVFGGGSMYLHGLKNDLDDIDLIARSTAWEKAKSLGEAIIPDSQVGKVVQLFDKSIEIFDKWTPGEWDIDELIDTAKHVDGIPYVTLENVVLWKKRMGRPKDFEHVKLIENYLGRKS